MNFITKGAGRLLAQKKEDYMIELTFHHIKILNDDIPDCLLVVEWKRGPESQQTNPIELNDLIPDNDMDDELSKVSSFYTKDGSKYEKKMCNFILIN